MRFDCGLVYTILFQEFQSARYEVRAKLLKVDYPLMYDPEISMESHVVLVASSDKVIAESLTSDSLYICVDADKAALLKEAGVPTIYIADNVSIQRVFNRLAMRFAAVDRWDAQLRSLIETYAGFQAMLDATSQLTSYAFVLMDAQYRVLCQSDGIYGEEEYQSELAGGIGALMADSVDLLMANPSYQRMRTSKRPFPVPGSSHMVMQNIFSGGLPIGALVVYRPENVAHARFARFVQERLSHHLEGMYNQIGSFGDVAAKPSLLYATIRYALEGKRVEWGVLERMLAGDGHSSATRFLLVQFERSFTYEGTGERGYLAHRVERIFPGAYCVPADDALFVLADVGPDDQSVHESFRRELSMLLREVLAKAGTSRVFSSIDQLYAARIQTDVALKRGAEVDPTYWCYRFEDYVLGWIMRHGVEGAPVECFLHPAITVLSHCDAEQGHQLLESLRAFMHCRYNASTASRELFVARSTLLNRLERIRELTGLNLDSPRERLYLALSFEMIDEMNLSSGNPQPTSST